MLLSLTFSAREDVGYIFPLRLELLTIDLELVVYKLLLRTVLHSAALSAESQRVLPLRLIAVRLRSRRRCRRSSVIGIDLGILLSLGG